MGCLREVVAVLGPGARAGEATIHLLLVGGEKMRRDREAVVRVSAVLIDFHVSGE